MCFNSSRYHPFTHMFTHMWQLLKNSGFKFLWSELNKSQPCWEWAWAFRDARKVLHCNVRSAEDFEHKTKQEQHCTIKCSTIMALSRLSCCHECLKPKSFIENDVKSISPSHHYKRSDMCSAGLISGDGDSHRMEASMYTLLEGIKKKKETQTRPP